MRKRTENERDRDRNTMSFRLNVGGPDPIWKNPSDWHRKKSINAYTFAQIFLSYSNCVVLWDF